MSNSRSRISALLAVTLLAVAACGTSHASKSKSPTPHPASASPGLPTPTPTPAPLSAPLLIQVENLYQARPQSGLSTAQVVYEYQTEGGIGRFTGIWYTVPPAADLVGPVRSARLVSLRLLQIYGGALIYSGASNYVDAQLSNTSNRHFDDPEPPLYRTSSASAPPAHEYGSPHNLYTNGSNLATFASSKDPGTVSYQLWQRTPIGSLPVGGAAVTSFQVPISTEETPIFSYDPVNDAYERSEPATPEYPGTGVLDDANNNDPWETPTVVILQVPTIPVAADNENPSGGYTEGLDFGIGPDASGSGQLAVGGQLYPISWAQGASGPPTFTLADGQPAPIAPGQVLIELVGQGAMVTPSAPAAPAA